MNKWQKYRKEFHLSVDYVSRCLRLHTQDYLEIENGNREPTKEEYSKLLTLYGLAVQSLEVSVKLLYAIMAEWFIAAAC